MPSNRPRAHRTLPRTAAAVLGLAAAVMVTVTGCNGSPATPADSPATGSGTASGTSPAPGSSAAQSTAGASGSGSPGTGTGSLPSASTASSRSAAPTAATTAAASLSRAPGRATCTMLTASRASAILGGAASASVKDLRASETNRVQLDGCSYTTSNGTHLSYLVWRMTTPATRTALTEALPPQSLGAKSFDPKVGTSSAGAVLVTGPVAVAQVNAVQADRLIQVTLTAGSAATAVSAATAAAAALAD